MDLRHGYMTPVQFTFSKMIGGAMAPDPKQTVVQLRVGTRIFRIPTSGASAKPSVKETEGVVMSRDPEPRHRIVASGDDDGIRWARCEPI